MCKLCGTNDTNYDDSKCRRLISDVLQRRYAELIAPRADAAAARLLLLAATARSEVPHGYRAVLAAAEEARPLWSDACGRRQDGEH